MGLWAAGTPFSASTPGKAGGLQLLRLIVSNPKTILFLAAERQPIILSGLRNHKVQHCFWGSIWGPYEISHGLAGLRLAEA